MFAATPQDALTHLRAKNNAPHIQALTQPSTLLHNSQTEGFPLWFAPAMHGFGGFSDSKKYD